MNAFKQVKSLAGWLGLVVCAAILTGCSSIGQVKPTQPHVTGALELPPNGNIGQTFTARFDGLEGVLIYLEPGQAPADVTLLLRNEPQGAPVWRSSTIHLGENDGPTFYRFAFDPFGDSRGRDFYFTVDSNGTTGVKVGSGPGDLYTDGALHRNLEPQDAQVAFKLDYDVPRLAVGLLEEGLTWLVWLLAAALVFILPGWALLNAFWPDWEALNWAEKLGLSSAVSLALYPILFLVTHWIGLNLGPLYAWLPAACAAAWLLWRSRAALRGIPGRRFDLRAAVQTGLTRGDLALILVIAAIAFTRFWAIRELDTPQWHDSYEHAMIVQLMQDHGGLFDNWEPYSPYYSLTVHFGFHAQTSVLSWVARMDAIQATLVNGQMVNILAMLTLLPLALRLARGSRWAGVGALIAAGLVSQMPAFYVNWGRFPQLSGQAILSVAIWLTWDLFDGFTRSSDGPAEGALHAGPRQTLVPAILLGVVLAGMTLTYYRMAIYYACFMLVWAMIWALSKYRFSRSGWTVRIVQGTVSAAITLALLAPWLLQMRSSWLTTRVADGVVKGTPLDNVMADLWAWQFWQDYLSPALLALSLAAVLVGIIRRRWMIPGVALWVGVIAAYSLGKVVNIPGANMLPTFPIQIFLYLPAALLAGYLAAEAAGWLLGWNPKTGAVLVNLAALLVIAWGANTVRQIAQPLTSSVLTRPDLRAMEWIKADIPLDARFLVEGFTQYNRSTAVGSDGGWWIPLITQRENTMPPQYTLMEKPNPPDYTEALVALVNGLVDHSATSPEGLRLMCENRITHIYIGQMQGKIGYKAVQLFTPQDFLNRPEFSLIYHHDRVFIFELQPWVCPGLGG